MQITEGAVGRVLVVRLEHGEPVVESLLQAAQGRGVRHAAVWLIGAAGRGELVVGPRKTELPPERWPMAFAEGRELVAVGTLFPGTDGPALHLHAAAGRGEGTLTGCVQKGTETFLVGEAVILELTGVQASRKPDPSGHFQLLDLSGEGGGGGAGVF